MLLMLMLSLGSKRETYNYNGCVPQLLFSIRSGYEIPHRHYECPVCLEKTEVSDIKEKG
jgi:hypothetical protein